MSLIRECRICGQRVSFRKMPHGKYVCFDVKTNNKHMHSKSEVNKFKKIEDKNQKTIEIKKDDKQKIQYSKKEKKIKEEDFSQSEEFEAYEENTSDEVFKEDTVESLRKEIDVETVEKKSNKSIIYIAIAVLVVIVLIFMNG
tara:strand:+ start:2941 stop:3366 length:426 start_codon:yes stop_codon:yes gene_type:complete